MALYRKYNEQVKEIMIRLAERGATIEEIAKTIGVCKKTIYLWKKRYPDFAQMLAEAKQEPDDCAEASLFDRATGYSHPAVKIFYDSKTGKTVEHKYTEHYPPDTVALIFWLKNRRPEMWREKPHGEADVVVNNITSKSDEDIDKRIKELLEKGKPK